MAFLLPRNPLKPLGSFQAQIVAGTRIVRRDELATLAQAQNLVNLAQQQAQAIVAQAQTAFEAKCQEGYASGLAQAKMEQAQDMIETVGRTVDYFAQVESEIVTLVMGAVRKIMDDFDDEQRILMVVRNALSVVRNQKQMTLRVYPGQIDHVRKHINDLLASYPGVGYLDIVPDARLATDACILESEIGLVEASITGQITALEQAFQKVLGSRI